jgi:hypothetical protein
MLTISKPLSATQAQTYHAKEFTAAEQNYWKQDDTIQGEWHGSGRESWIGKIPSRLRASQWPALRPRIMTIPIIFTKPMATPALPGKSAAARLKHPE